MTLKAKYQYKHEDVLRDARPWTIRMKDGAREPANAAIALGMAATAIWMDDTIALFADLILFLALLYFWWLMSQPRVLPFRLPKSAGIIDKNYKRPNGKYGMADGIMYIGNDDDTGEEVWFTNNDCRTHMLYLGTTGSGKTFGLKSIACNALCWGSGFIYIDGKADTDLWSTLSAMSRRFGRDDDLLIMNYMTGNVTGNVPSNTLNPFSSGSASYLTNMLVSLMPDAEGDNAMWKERAVALVSSLMPCLVWKRENQNIPLSIGVIRKYLTFKDVIKLSRDQAVPEHLRAGIQGYLDELPGYVDSVFDDEGNEKSTGPDAGMVDTSVPRQQHGYLSMQFTRSMQSLGDDYGFIFDTQAADVDMMDVVLNRRILVVLIPALEKSSDETANLGKIIASTLKGMMGATLGNTVEGDTATAIENKPTNSATPFIAIFDEVGYYTAQGMAVMAAQARSLGFSLVFAGQDLPALEKRVKEEARSITANCNIKLFGKLEDPTQTKDFFEKTVGSALVTEVSGYARSGGRQYQDSQQASIQSRAKASYDGLKGFTEGRAVCAFGKTVQEIMVYNSDIGHAKAMRVHRFLPVPPPSEDALANLREIDTVLKAFRDPKWSGENFETAASMDIAALADGFAMGKKAELPFIEMGALAVASVAEAHGMIDESDLEDQDSQAEKAPAEPQALSATRTDHNPVEEEDGEGPLSWTEVIGGVDQPAGTPSPFRVPPPVVEDVDRKGKGGKDQISWEDLVGDEADGDSSPSDSPAPAASDDDEDDSLIGLSQDDAGAVPFTGPMSWMDVIGGDDAVADVSETPAQPTAPSEPPSKPQDPVPLDKDKNDVVETDTDDEQEKPGKGMSWGDVIGVSDDVQKS